MHANNRLDNYYRGQTCYIQVSIFLEVIVDEQAGLTLTWPEPGRHIFFSRTEIYLWDARL